MLKQLIICLLWSIVVSKQLELYNVHNNVWIGSKKFTSNNLCKLSDSLNLPKASITNPKFFKGATCGMCLAVGNQIFMVVENNWHKWRNSHAIEVDSSIKISSPNSWKAVGCPVSNVNIAYRNWMSSNWWLKLQVFNTRYSLKSVAVKASSGAKYVPLQVVDGFWQFRSGTLFELFKNGANLLIKVCNVYDKCLTNVLTPAINKEAYQTATGKHPSQFAVQGGAESSSSSSSFSSSSVESSSSSSVSESSSSSSVASSSSSSVSSESSSSSSVSSSVSSSSVESSSSSSVSPSSVESSSSSSVSASSSSRSSSANSSAYAYEKCNCKRRERRRLDIFDDVQGLFTLQSKRRLTYYYGSGVKNCGLQDATILKSGFQEVAATTLKYAQGIACGTCIEIYHPKGMSGKGNNPPAAVTKAIITDRMMRSDVDIDIFKPLDGIWNINWKAIPCPTIINSQPLYLTYRFEGSHRWYLKLQVRNGRYPVKSIYLVNNDITLKRPANVYDNYFIGSKATGVTFPLKVKVCDIWNQCVEDVLPDFRKPSNPDYLVNGVDKVGTKKVQFPDRDCNCSERRRKL